MPHADAAEIVERTTMRAIIGLPAEYLDQAMATAYRCYTLGRLGEAEILCKGLLAADHRYWWAYSLYAAVLRNQGRLDEALVQIDAGLKYEPGQPKLVAMQLEMKSKILARATAARKEAA